MFSPDHLLDEARVARQAATRLRAAAQVVDQARRLPWRSVAADRFRDQAGIRVRHLETVAAACDAAARAAVQAADELAAESRRAHLRW